jgi:predicted amidohydrolase
MGFVVLGEEEMNINHYYLHKISEKRMREFLDAEEQHRMIKLAYPTEDKPHWMTVIMKKIKDFALNLLNLRDGSRVSKTRKIHSYTESGPT